MHWNDQLSYILLYLAFIVLIVAIWYTSCAITNVLFRDEEDIDYIEEDKNYIGTASKWWATCLVVFIISIFI